MPLDLPRIPAAELTQPPLSDKSILLETVGCSHNILHVAITSCIPTGDKNNKSESSSEQRQGSSATVIGDQGGFVSSKIFKVGISKTFNWCQF